MLGERKGRANRGTAAETIRLVIVSIVGSSDAAFGWRAPSLQRRLRRKGVQLDRGAAQRGMQQNPDRGGVVARSLRSGVKPDLRWSL